jgi:hypothetical protein
MGFASLYPSCDRLTSLDRHCERSEAMHGAANGEVDCFAALAMTWIQFRDLAALIARRLLENFPPSCSEGAGKTGCLLHPRSRVRFAQTKVHGYRRSIPAFPARQANHPGLAAAADADPNDGSKRTISILIALFGNQPNRDAREPPSSPPRGRDNLSGKPEDPDRTVQATLAMGPLPARRLLACHHRSRKVGSCGRIAGAWLRVRRHWSKGSSADALSSYQSPDLRSAIAG